MGYVDGRMCKPEVFSTGPLYCLSNPRHASWVDMAVVDTRDHGPMLNVLCGCRYCSLLNSVVCLTSALEDARSLLLIGAGARGVAPLRAAMEWPPVQVG